MSFLLFPPPPFSATRTRPTARKPKRPQPCGEIVERRQAESAGGAPAALPWTKALRLYLNARPKLSPNSTRGLDAVVQVFAAWVGGIPVEETARDTVAAWREARQTGDPAAKNGKKSGPGTRNKNLTCLRAIARWARSEGLIRDIPFEPLRARPHRRAPGRPLAVDELPRYLDDLAEFLRWPVLFGLCTGLRAGAVCHLLDVDATDKGVSIRREKRDKWPWTTPFGPSWPARGRCGPP